MPKNLPLKERTNSRSQILEYLNCGYRWDLGYNRGIASTKVREALDLGSAVHRGIKAAVHVYALGSKAADYVKGKMTYEQRQFAVVQKGIKTWEKEERDRRGMYLTDEIEAQITELGREAVGIAIKGLEHIDLPSWEVAMWEGQPVCEVEFMVPLYPWKGYRTIPDFVARKKEDGKNAPFWLVDWKCRSSFDEDDAEDINLQFSTMQFVLTKKTNIKIGGSILWQIKAQAPRKPTQNKDGKMSRAAIVTDWATYSAALREANLDPADYEDMKEKLDQVEWFRALKQHRSPAECNAWWEQVVMPAAKAMALRPQIIRRSSHTPFACRGCWARDFCLAELRGDDTEFLLETDYMDTRSPRKMREIGDKRRTFNLDDE